MEIVFLPKAEEDMAYWIKTGDKTILKKIAQLVRAIVEDPYSGIGKPEALKYDLAPKWSRRISKEHRIVYHVQGDILYVYSVRGHYD